MIDLLELHKLFILRHLGPGDTAVDFTMGNGHDTVFLSQTVGETGHVYAFDIQPQALESTEKHLKEAGCPNNVTLILDSHHQIASYVKKPFKAGMFNLGWLPGGDKSVTTQRETTLKALESGLALLDHDGIILLAVYPGHAEGTAEGQEVQAYLSSLSRYQICATLVRIVNSPDSPYFFIIEKK
ncbi:MAG: class I SAM-dependent methyltransferase [Clostridia bacterium]|nr:class I SAM-dependent methyltransferase [Clostridia bacterium]